MMLTVWKTSSAGILPAVPRASRPRRPRAGGGPRPTRGSAGGPGALLSAAKRYKSCGHGARGRAHQKEKGAGVIRTLFLLYKSIISIPTHLHRQVIQLYFPS